MPNSISRSLLLFALCLNIVSAAYISNINQLKPSEKKIVDWVKKWTVPNTRDGNGNPWTSKSLPKALTSWSGYDSSIKPAAWAAAIVSAWSLSEGIFKSGDFYRAPNKPPTGLIDTRCPCFKFPAKLPAAADFPIEVFTYSLCQGKAANPNPKTDSYGTVCNCECTGTEKCPGKLIGPNQNCYGRRSGESDWQNGMFGMEQSHIVSAQNLATRAENIYHHIRGSAYTYVDVLDNTLTVAGFPKGTDIYENIMGCFPINKATGKRRSVPAKDLSWTCADLVSMWLVRNHLVGLTVAINDNLGTLPTQLTEIKVLAKYYNS